MSQFTQLLSMLREQMHATIARSDVLKPLAWLITVLCGTTLGSFYLDAPSWFSITLAVFLGAGLLLYIFSYAFCLFSNPDALRSARDA